jgi:Mg-chelatase subunit ChlI
MTPSRDIDPAVAELVVTIRDRFGISGMRDAQAMLTEEVALAERALAALEVDDEPEAADAPLTDDGA